VEADMKIAHSEQCGEATELFTYPGCRSTTKNKNRSLRKNFAITIEKPYLKVILMPFLVKN
jgi:hypothetical protein